MTAVTLANAPIGQPVIDLKTGYLTRPWAQWFSQGLWERIGGAVAPSIGDYDDSSPPSSSFVSDAMAEIAKAIQGLGVVPLEPQAIQEERLTSEPTIQPVVAQLDHGFEARISSIEASIAALQSQAEGMQAGPIL